MTFYVVVGAFIAFVVLAMVFARCGGRHGGYSSDNGTWNVGGD